MTLLRSLFYRATFGSVRREQEATRLAELRTQMLRFCLVTVAGLAALYLSLCAMGVISGRMYPWDGAWTLLICAICWLLLRRNSPFVLTGTASFFLATIAQPLGYATGFYGVEHPVNALYLLIILIAGLVIGGWFIPVWIVAVCSVMGSVAIGSSLNFEEGDLIPYLPLADTLRALAIWYALIIFTGLLTWFFTRTLERATQIARGQTLALARSLNALNAEQSLDDFLGSALTTIAEQLGAKYVTLSAHDKERDLLVQRLFFTEGKLFTPAQLPVAPLPPTPASDVPLWQEMLRIRQPIVISDPSNDPRLKYRARILADGIRSILLTPLISGNEVIGWFNINRTERHSFSRDEIELASALAQQAALALQMTAYAEQQQQSTLLQERNRLAREIHDTLAQGFTGIVLQLETAEDILQTDGPASNETAQALPYLARAKATARQSLSEARRSVWALRPHTLERRSLTEALRESAQMLVAGSALQLTCTLADDLPALPAEMETDLLRLVQEAITNVIKHAAASHLVLRLERLSTDKNRLRLLVQDDGSGFDPQTTQLPSGQGGFGLINMRERIERHGGALTVQSESGNTAVEAIVPINGAL